MKPTYINIHSFLAQASTCSTYHNLASDLTLSFPHFPALDQLFSVEIFHYISFCKLHFMLNLASSASESRSINWPMSMPMLMPMLMLMPIPIQISLLANVNCNILSHCSVFLPALTAV